MDLKQLRGLVAIVDHGGVSRAARHMNISQSALSQSLARLEAQLEVTLFERTSKGVVLTPYGTAVVGRARSILRETQAAIEDIETLRGKGRGHLIIGTGPVYATTLVSEAVHQIMITRPELRVTVIQGGIDALGTELARGQIDVALATREETHGVRQLTSEVVTEDVVGVVSGVDHPLAAKPKLSLADTRAYPWALPDSKIVQNKLKSLFAQHSLGAPRIQVESSILGFLQTLVAKGTHLTFLPQALLTQRSGVQGLIMLPVAEAMWRRTLHVVYPQGRALSRTARLFVDVLRSLPERGGTRSR